jgi:hypothetical protein
MPKPKLADLDLPPLERLAEANERALASLRDDLHNAAVQAASATGEALHAALTRRRALERELDELLESSAPVIARLKAVRADSQRAARAAQVERLRAAVRPVPELAQAAERRLADAAESLRALVEAVNAATAAARPLGINESGAVRDAADLHQLKAWLLNTLDGAGLAGIEPARQPYNPAQLADGTPPSALAATLTSICETTR